MDFVIRYKGECVLLEVKAKDGNTKSTRTILNHPEKYHDYHAIKLGNYNVGGKEGMMTMLFPKQTQRMAASLPAFSSVMIALIVGMQNSGLARLVGHRPLRHVSDGHRPRCHLLRLADAISYSP